MPPPTMMFAVVLELVPLLKLAEALTLVLVLVLTLASVIHQALAFLLGFCAINSANFDACYDRGSPFWPTNIF